MRFWGRPESVTNHLLIFVFAISLAACEAAPVKELTRSTPPNVDLAAKAPPAQSDNVPEIDKDWAKQGPIAARFDNMAFRAEGAASRFNVYISRLLEARGFNVATANLSKSEANAGAEKEWWDEDISKPLRPVGGGLELKLTDVVRTALRESEQVKAFGMLPSIRQTAVREAQGRFVPEAFAEARSAYGNDPLTSASLVNNGDRLRRDDAIVEGGLRGRVRTGAEITLAQRFGYVDTNSTDFDPDEQSESRTTLTIIQPLLRGSGLTYNDAPTKIAKIDTEVALFELTRQLETYLLEVERSYWSLYAARARLFLARRLSDFGGTLASQARARADVDVDPTDVIRAEAARDRWSANVVRAETAVSNAQYRVAALTNGGNLVGSTAEFIAVTPPKAESSAIGREAILREVLERRPELRQAFLQYEAAALREGISANENLPELDLIVEGSLSGNDRGQRFGSAVDDSEPGGLIGLRFSVPLGYDERQARFDRRRLETVQQRHQTRSAIATVFLEVEVSANEYAVAAKDLTQQRRARSAAQKELDAVKAQWDEGAGFARRGQALSNLLDAHERLNEREGAVAEARATLAVAAANFNRARGVLLNRWGVMIAPAVGVRGEPTYRVSMFTAKE